MSTPTRQRTVHNSWVPRLPELSVAFIGLAVAAVVGHLWDGESWTRVVVTGLVLWPFLTLVLVVARRRSRQRSTAG